MMIRAEPNFEWQVAAVDRVARLLKTVADALDAANVPYAVIGGNAVAMWIASRDVGAVRATKDVDLLLRREDLSRAAAALKPAGFIPEEVWGVPVFLEEADPLPSQGVHIIWANEPVRADSRVPAPDVSCAKRVSGGYMVLDLPALLAMKLDANRRHDQVHVEDLLRMGLIDSAMAAGLPPVLLDRLRHIRDTMEWRTEPPEF